MLRVLDALLSLAIRLLDQAPTVIITLLAAYLGARIQRRFHREDNPPAKVRPHVILSPESDGSGKIRLAFDLWNVGVRGTARWTKLEVRVSPPMDAWDFTREDSYVYMLTSRQMSGQDRFVLLKAVPKNEVKGRLCPDDHEMYLRGSGPLPTRQHGFDIRISAEGMEVWNRTFEVLPEHFGKGKAGQRILLISGKTDTELGKPVLSTDG